MKCASLKYAVLGSAAAMILALGCAGSNPALGARLQGAVVTGQVTSTYTSGQIEVDHRAYRIKTDSAAAHTVHAVHLGQVVDLEFDGPVVTPTAQVITIAPHAGS
jgi:hypothetical protein